MRRFFEFKAKAIRLFETHKIFSVVFEFSHAFGNVLNLQKSVLREEFESVW